MSLLKQHPRDVARVQDFSLASRMRATAAASGHALMFDQGRAQSAGSQGVSASTAYPVSVGRLRNSNEH
jgi:hypothetical protein